jgi:omega-6 fatty acid desaturase (delta-12 desaturase)
LIRNPLIMLGLGPIVVFVIKQRFKGALCEGMPRGRRWIELHATTVAAIALGTAGCWIFGAAMFLTVWSLSFWLAGATGIFLFYMQHNFDGAYYAQDRRDYSFQQAAIQGASFFDLPRWAHWCTGNIGYHHIHHLASRIPNYKLRRCFRDLPELHEVTRLSILNSMRCATLKLWDEDLRQLVSFRHLRTVKV